MRGVGKRANRACTGRLRGDPSNPAAAHPVEIHLHIYGEYKYGIGLMVVVITNAMGLLKHWNRVPTERVDVSATPTVEEKCPAARS